MKTILPALGVAVIAAASAAAQSVSLAPSYGSITLDSGFLPDPYSVQMRAGGNISVSSNVNGSGVCRGYIADAPDFNLYYGAGQFELFLSAISQTDTTLVVRDPRGNWFCDDDGGEGLNPGINIDRPASGLYSVWVGTYSSSAGLPPATLYVSEIGFGPRPQGIGLNPSLASNYGSQTLQTGFVPDPVNVSIAAGGDVDVSESGLEGCWGYATAAPDYELTYAAGNTFDLYLSATSSRDTVIIVNAPDGSWHCNDDGAEGLNPGLMFENPQSGVYDIWVGTYSSSAGTPPATLHISELGFGGESAPQPTGLLDYNLPSNYGSVSLNSGFLPDPYNVQIAAGGNIDVSETGLPGCWGYATSAPDYELTYSAGNAFDLYLSATSSRDTVIIVNAPDGTWHCNDDGAEGLNPGLMFENPQSGVYDIWVGTYSSSAGTPPATLHISELSFGGQTVPQQSNMLDFSLPSNYGSVSLNSGFLPDPYNVQIAAGGNVDVRDNGPDGCWGYATAAPDFELTYAAGNTFDLYLSATSSRDTVIIVNAPDGSWHCNDDGAEGLNPGLMFENPQSGVYDIWVGTYSSSAGTPPATLHISEIEFGDN
ncbi:hypothetical protein V0U79_13240 [Hyphobacterium sp. HN65]|uniref:Peptidase S1 n=1 Tax=Hyphobacterium lacteum TaxID=3116575 RepID=A0ABU7LTZ6_9PROT|nr:hypothetical protein [Hyphobacterium sp. HN65]MEE2527325.1 hypothetical protein [Hyphobacterium sp. HN65]